MLVHFFCIYGHHSLHIMLNVSCDILKFCFHQLVTSFPAIVSWNICLPLGIHHTLYCTLLQLVLSNWIIIFLRKYLKHNTIVNINHTYCRLLWLRSLSRTLCLLWASKKFWCWLLFICIPSVVFNALFYEVFAFCYKISRLVQTLISIATPSASLNQF